MVEKYLDVKDAMVVEVELKTRDDYEKALKIGDIILSTSNLKYALKELGIKFIVYSDETQKFVQNEFAKSYVEFFEKLNKGQAFVNAESKDKPAWMK